MDDDERLAARSRLSRNILLWGGIVVLVIGVLAGAAGPIVGGVLLLAWRFIAPP